MEPPRWPLPGVVPGVLVAFLGAGRPSAVIHEGQEAGFALGAFAEHAE